MFVEVSAVVESEMSPICLYLEHFFPADGTVLGGYRTLRRWGLIVRSRPLGLGR